jgi:predicted ATPase
MIRRVRIDGYKSFHNTEIELSPLTLIVGPNAAGKSNLFDALHLLSRIVMSRSLQEAFDDHRGDPIEAFSYSEGGLEVLLQKEKATFTIEVDIELSQDVKSRTERLIERYAVPSNKTGNRYRSKSYKIVDSLLRYRISIYIVPKTGALRVEDEELIVFKGSWSNPSCDNNNARPIIEKVSDHFHLWMEGQDCPLEYEVELDYAIASQPLYPPYCPYLIALREELASWQFYYLEPRLMRVVSPIKESNTVTSLGGDLASFYWTLQRKHPGQFHNIEKALQTFIPTIEGIKIELINDGYLRLKVKEDNVEYSEKVVSNSTLRLLALLAILSPQNPASVIGIEEPENGIHPRRLRHIARLLQNASEKRQIIVNTHSTLLLDYFDSDRIGIVQCFKKYGQTHFQMLHEVKGLCRKSDVGNESEETLPSEQILMGYWG